MIGSALVILKALAATFHIDRRDQAYFLKPVQGAIDCCDIKGKLPRQDLPHESPQPSETAGLTDDPQHQQALRGHAVALAA